MDRTAALLDLQEWLPGLEAVKRYLATPSRYALMVDGHEVEVGTVEQLLSQSKLRARIVEATLRLPGWVHNTKWDAVLERVLAAVTDVEVAQTSDYDLLLEWLALYLEQRKPVLEADERNWLPSLRQEQPVFYRGEVAVNVNGLARWLHEHRNEKRTSPSALAMLLKRYGAESVLIRAMDGGVRRGRRYWVLPTSLLPEWLITSLEDVNQTYSDMDQVEQSGSEEIAHENTVQDGDGTVEQALADSQNLPADVVNDQTAVPLFQPSPGRHLDDVPPMIQVDPPVPFDNESKERYERLEI